MHATSADARPFSSPLAIILPTHAALAFLVVFRVATISLQVVIAGTSLTLQLVDHLLVVEGEDFEDFGLDAGLRVELIICDALADFVNFVDVIHVLAILRVNLDQPFHQLPLQFNDLATFERVGNGHPPSDADGLVLVGVDLGLDALKDVVLLVRVLGQHPQVLLLLDFNHLDEGLANLPVFVRDLLMRIQSGHCTPFLLE